MKKYTLLMVILLFSVMLASCSLFETRINKKEKYEIVSEKYGELEYISENIIVYKNLKDEFSHIDGVDYIVKNSGNRGSVGPELSQNFYVIIDIVKHGDTYKVLVYNNVLRNGTDKTKVFILTDYFLPIEIEDVLTLFDNHNITQDIKRMNIDFIKKDCSWEYDLGNIFDIELAYYHKAFDGEVFMSFYDYQSGHRIIGNEYGVIFGNEKEKKIYFPSDLNFADYIKINHNTLDDLKVDFSLDKGENFKLLDDRLETFDIWREEINSEVQSAIFFYAFTYEEFLIQVDKARNPNFYTYNYMGNEGLDDLIKVYDESFFENHIFIFYYKYEPNISENYVYSVTTINNILTVNINRFEGMATALSAWQEIITIKKTDVEGIDKVNLVLRTVSPLQSSVIAYIDEAYMREFYLHEPTIADFAGLENLKDIDIFTWSLNVDLRFNKEISDDVLNSVVQYLESHENVKSTGYKGKDFIRVQLNNKFYDEVLNKTLVITDFIDDDAFIEAYDLTISILNFTPLAYIRFNLEVQGKEQAAKMIDDIINGEYPLIKKEWLHSEYIYPAQDD